MKTMAVEFKQDQWADVIALIRDLLGEKWIVWQDRTGSVGVIKASAASVRIV